MVPNIRNGPTFEQKEQFLLTAASHDAGGTEWGVGTEVARDRQGVVTHAHGETFE